jgi:hypothetical protein
METINLRLTLTEDAPIDEYLEDGIITEYFPVDENRMYQVIIKDVDESLIESLNPDELCEFFGIDSEFVIATEVLEFA